MCDHNFTDVKNVISKILDSSTGRIMRSGIVGALGSHNPVVGTVAGMGNVFLDQYNTYKFQFLLKGLSSELNSEMYLNELYNFVVSDEEKAIAVANLFRKTINAECPKVCVIYGLILGKNVESDTLFTQEELIICRALENATDYDLNNFKEIMENYLNKQLNESRIIFPKGFSELDRYISTCEWCVYNRIFTSSILEWKKIEDESITTHYYATRSALVLLDYIKSARRTWNYEK